MRLLPITEGNVPVAMFSLGKQHMFLPVSKSYQVSSSGFRKFAKYSFLCILLFKDMLRRVVEDFDLEEDVLLSFRTSTMDVCRGRKVLIPESAYIYLWKHLNEVDVSIVGRVQGL